MFYTLRYYGSIVINLSQPIPIVRLIKPNTMLDIL